MVGTSIVGVDCEGRVTRTPAFLACNSIALVLAAGTTWSNLETGCRRCFSSSRLSS
jgi:hypothetical protein